MSTRWQDIFNQLKTAGIDVYSPASKRGECLTPYCVVLQETSQRVVGISTDIDYYSVLCYVPQGNYSGVADYVNAVKTSMRALEPMIKPTGAVTTPYLDEDVKAFMVSIEYRNYRKL